ncbi:hypothetical protein BO221_00600 [Archangium sp. Cb G35]|uniref:hypothetical protein n=1 Tax=Archangium sp. Cb G35 TaxID=1920190 RepID=UPI000937D700|nr:hypothetical protein [Archangium sp. Cb G35]OJT26579.1 hypothetical protein BO221_00600 [Archangium sp. Cb G35]
MPKKLEKPEPPKRSEVIELDDALLDLAVGGLDSDLFKDNCPSIPTTNPGVSTPEERTHV